MQHFVMTTTFSSTRGLEVTDEMKVVVVASACRLTLNRLRGLADASDGENVGYHEFAHALDGADASMDGEAHGPPSQIMRSGHT